MTDAHAFYKDTLVRLREADIPHLVGGAYAMRHYADIERDTKDLDVFLRRVDVERALDVLAKGGRRTQLTSAVWLGKAFDGDHLVDLIFGADNGVAVVDDAWFTHAEDGVVLGEHVRMIPVEEMIWSKAFVQDRERHDGADIAHLLRARAERLDWDRLLLRFGPHWRVLAAHLILFGFVYPAERGRLPREVMHDLVERLRGEIDLPTDEAPLCRGTLLSRHQYVVDVEKWGYVDARTGTRQ